MLVQQFTSYGTFYQVFFDYDRRIWVRNYSENTWGDWVDISTPSYLRSYSDLSSLANALGVLNIKSALDVTSQMNQAWIDGMEASFQATGSSNTWFQGYNSAAQECGWFGYRTYQNNATVICIVGYNNDTNMLCKGCRDNGGNWTFYRFVGGL